ncbi:MAG: sorbitol dehydrogenase [Hyphomicrobiales bacterium]|nr:MAG: sorbitol dehydrogenase [Hyphomicrobiales bacterium]
MTKLEGKSALITGAGRGIGKAFAERYAREGARVALADIDLEAAKNAAAEIGGDAIAVEMNVIQQASIEAAIAKTVQAFGGIDILINNAGIFDMAPIAEITPAMFERIFSINVYGTFFTMQAVAMAMVERGKGGKIINMASQAGRRGEALVAVYCASKAAVISLTQSAGLDLITHGINVNAISPGVVDGDHWDEVDAKFAKYEGLKPGEKKIQVAASVPFGRMGTAEDLTGMAVFLGSSDSDYVVAQTYNVDGGNWMN